jgi:CRP-like cAMP-binding protein
VRVSSARARAIDDLRSLQLLRCATDKELSRIDRVTFRVEVVAGRVVIREGEHSRGFFLIVSGRSIVTVAGVEHGVLGPGMFFGETALLDGAPEPATVTALTPMRLRVASRDEFDELSEVRSFARAMLKTLVARQRRAYDEGSRRLVMQPMRIRELG